MPRVGKLLGVGLALRMFDYGFLSACTKPKAVIQAADDEYGGRAEIEAAVSGMADPKQLWVVDAATHLFPGRLDAFESAAREAVAYLGRQKCRSSGRGHRRQVQPLSTHWRPKAHAEPLHARLVPELGLAGLSRFVGQELRRALLAAHAK